MKFHSDLTLYFQQVSSSAVIGGRSQHTLEVNSFLSARMTQDISCSVRSTGAVGTPEARARLWWIQKKDLELKIATGPTLSMQEGEGFL